jgi:cytochrome c oxidase subunit 4
MDAMHEPRHPEEKPLPRVSTYLLVGLILTVVTAIEVWAFYWPIPAWVIVTSLIILSLMKFWLVVAFFMHLRYDHKMFTSLFTLGLVLAIGVVLGLITLFDNFDIGNPPPVDAATPPPPTKTVPPPDTPTPPPSELTDGAAIFVQRGCGGCHVIEGLPGAVGVTGPEMTGIGSRAGTRVAGLSAEDYIRQSVEEPEAFVLEGYDNVMQPLRGMMTDEEFDILVEYLLTLQ